MNINNVLKQVKGLKVDKSIDLALRRKKVVHGVTVSELTTAKHLEAIKSLTDVPKTLINDVFGDVNDAEILEKYSNVSIQDMLELGLRLIAVAPDYILGAVATLLDIDVEILKEKTLNENIDIIKALLELNRYDDFFKTAKALMPAKAKKALTSFGYKI